MVHFRFRSCLFNSERICICMTESYSSNDLSSLLLFTEVFDVFFSFDRFLLSFFEKLENLPFFFEGGGFFLRYLILSSTSSIKSSPSKVLNSYVRLSNSSSNFSNSSTLSKSTLCFICSIRPASFWAYI